MRLKSLNLYVMSVFSMMAVGCSSHMYSKQARLYVDVVTAELISVGACPSIDVCKKEQMVMWEGGGWKVGPFKGGGIDINVYKIADRRIADAVLARCNQIYVANSQVAVSITIQSNAHIDNNHPGKRMITKEAQFQAREI